MLRGILLYLEVGIKVITTLAFHVIAGRYLYKISNLYLLIL